MLARVGWAKRSVPTDPLVETRRKVGTARPAFPGRIRPPKRLGEGGAAPLPTLPRSKQNPADSAAGPLAVAAAIGGRGAPPARADPHPRGGPLGGAIKGPQPPRGGVGAAARGGGSPGG